jgi:hypothetical protein
VDHKEDSLWQVLADVISLRCFGGDHDDENTENNNNMIDEATSPIQRTRNTFRRKKAGSYLARARKSMRDSFFKSSLQEAMVENPSETPTEQDNPQR